MVKQILVEDGEDPRRFIYVEEWRTLEEHLKYEMNRQGVIRHSASKKVRNEPNGSFRYYENGVRKGVPIHILLEQTFSDDE